MAPFAIAAIVAVGLFGTGTVIKPQEPVLGTVLQGAGIGTLIGGGVGAAAAGSVGRRHLRHPAHARAAEPGPSGPGGRGPRHDCRVSDSQYRAER